MNINDTFVERRIEDGAKRGRAVDALGKRVWFKIQDWYRRRDALLDADGKVIKDSHGNPLKGPSYKSPRIITVATPFVKNHANRPVEYYRRKNNSKIEQRMKLAMMRHEFA